jgi:long-subunit acyl-CoA synthetase (AMP-forming)
MMSEYFRDPERSAQVLADGFIHSGDTGRFDARGNLHVVGRINDTFKTAKGKFVVPAQAETVLAGSALIDQVLVTGRGLPQPIALIGLSPAAQHHARPQLEAELSQLLAAMNRELAPHERVSHLVVLDEGFSLDNGLLTPTLKVRRHGVEARYERQYERWSKHPSPVVWPGQEPPPAAQRDGAEPNRQQP